MKTKCIGHSWQTLETILARACQGGIPSKKEISFLLRLRDERQIDALFKTARDLRRMHFGDTVFLYGFLYISTYCRNDCSFCFFRRSNTACRRYRKDTPEIVEAAGRLAASGVHLIDLTMGEDPFYFHRGALGFETLVNLVRAVKAATQLPIMVSPGAVPDVVLRNLSKAGATWYACYQETHQRALFNQLRSGQSYNARMGKKQLAHRLGLLIEEGLLSGVGESPDDVAESIAAMQSVDADQVRVMGFVPQEGTPMQHRRPADPERELKIMAVMRLVFPDRLIPASLDVDGLAGLKQRLEAGANVVTSIVPPGLGLAGVAQSFLDIKDARRTRASVLPVLEACGLRAGTTREYLAWIESRWAQAGWRNCRARAV